jgi:hypothetical protein
MVHTALAAIPGHYGLGGGPGSASPFGVYRPATVPADAVSQYVTILGGDTVEIESTVTLRSDQGVTVQPVDTRVTLRSDQGVTVQPVDTRVTPRSDLGVTEHVPLGTVFGTRSGDKGGNANLGVFARSDEAWEWLDSELTTEMLQELLPETADLQVDRHRLANVRSLNFVIHDLLDEGVAASTRQDAQAKALGEWLRARHVDLPISLL